MISDDSRIFEGSNLPDFGRKTAHVWSMVNLWMVNGGSLNLFYQAGFEGRYLTVRCSTGSHLDHIGSMFPDSQVNQTLANLTMFIMVYGQKS